MTTIGLIPARFDSTRFPGKPMARLQGKPMILWTWERASKAKSLDTLYVVTDHQEIYDTVIKAGGQAIMTGPALNGTERCLLALEQLQGPPDARHQYQYVVNIQGDEPLVEPEHIDLLVETLKSSSKPPMAALAAPINNEQDWRHPGSTKVVMSNSNRAMYFSRAPIPSSKDGGYHPDKVKYYRNCGMYGFDLNFLQQLNGEKPTKLQLEEDLEQLKALELNHGIQMVLVDEVQPGIDYPEQLDELNKLFS